MSFLLIISVSYFVSNFIKTTRKEVQDLLIIFMKFTFFIAGCLNTVAFNLNSKLHFAHLSTHMWISIVKSAQLSFKKHKIFSFF
jgi:hypothetical protein